MQEKIFRSDLCLASAFNRGFRFRGAVRLSKLPRLCSSRPESSQRLSPGFPVPGFPDAETAGSATGPHIAVNYLLVKSLAESYGIFPDRILGCVIADELGHVLLGPNSHSSKGVMTARWTDVELQRIGHWSILRFLPSEKQRLRAYVVSQQQMESKPATPSIFLARRNHGDRPPIASLW